LAKKAQAFLDFVSHEGAAPTPKKTVRKRTRKTPMKKKTG
jgi:hypothetical protein